MQKILTDTFTGDDTMTIADLIVDSIQDIKGKNIIKMDLRKIDEAPSDFFIVCEGESSTQVSAIAGNVEKRMKVEMGIRAAVTEGKAGGRWVLVDYFNVIVHIFHPEVRAYYEIEDLWRDAKITEYQDL